MVGRGLCLVCGRGHEGGAGEVWLLVVEVCGADQNICTCPEDGQCTIQQSIHSEM